MRCPVWPWILLLATQVSAQDAKPAPLRLTIDDAVARALAGSWELHANRRDVDVAQANLERSRALMPSNPFVSGGGQHTSHSGSNYVFLLSQEIEVGGQRRQRMTAAAEGVEKANWELKGAERTVAATVKTAFVQALIDRERVAVSRQGVVLAAQLASEIDQRAHTSDAQRIELNVAQIEEIRTRRDLVVAERARDASLDHLRRMVGLGSEQEVELAGAPESHVRDLPPVPDLVAKALRQRPDLTALQHDIQRTDAQLALSKREGIPNITVSSIVQRFEGDTLIGGDVGVPIPLFQTKAADVHEAVAERTRAGFQAQRLEQTIAEEVADARRACVDAGEDLRSHQQDIIPKSEENAELERALYERGAVGVAELVGIEIDLLTARRDSLDALQSYNDALIELERAVGGSLTAPPDSPAAAR
jgi:outer membrane protein, heavy metal efflux system